MQLFLSFLRCFKETQQTHCTSYFSLSVIKNRDQKDKSKTKQENLKNIIFTDSSRGIDIYNGGEDMRLAQEAKGWYLNNTQESEESK